MPSLPDQNLMQPVSNDLDDFSSPGFGPEQADIKVKSCQYISFDYKGKQSNDPVVSVQMDCEPLDGSNEGKDFTIEWTTGAKMADFAIMDGGGHLVAKSGSSRTGLYVTSNWALLLKSLKDSGYDTKLLNSDAGIHSLDGAELTLKQVPQPKREGLSDKNDAGYDKKYYTCLKIIALPGEAKKGRRAAPKPTSTSASPSASPASPAPAPASPSSNGTMDHASILTEALSSSGGSIPLDQIQKVCFDIIKTKGKSVKDAFAISKECAMEDNYLAAAMANNWVVSNTALSLG